jgi:hypothetical protein
MPRYLIQGEAGEVIQKLSRVYDLPRRAEIR